MSKYQIPTHTSPCTATIPISTTRKILTILVVATFSLSIIIYVLFNILNISIFTKNILTPQFTYYLVCTQSTSDEISTSHDDAKNIKMRGGAGNIIPYSPNNLIALHAYFTQEKADEIITSLKDQEITAQILPLHTIQHNITSYTQPQQQNIQSNITFLQNLLTSLYDIITQFDTLNISENKLYTNIYRLKISCDQELSSLNTLPNFESNPIYLQMLDVTSILQSLCNRDFNGHTITTISCEFKYSFIQIILSICEKITEK